MHLDKTDSYKLIQLGFQRKNNAVLPYDYYQYKNQIWVLGGLLYPKHSILSPSYIYQKGTWLVALFDMIWWLEVTKLKYELTHICKGYNVFYLKSIFDKKKIREKGVILSFTFAKFIEKIITEQKRIILTNECEYYLSEELTTQLKNLGYKQQECIHQWDILSLNNEAWVAGGILIPRKSNNILVPKEIVKKGKKLINLHNLIEWLTERINFTLTFDGASYLLTIFDDQENCLELEDISLLILLYKMVKKMLENNPEFAKEVKKLTFEIEEISDT